ncbi:hypothetical protein FHW69_001100 [Luteibacter sp. Sphag1AF]|uniref:energy transducer TonB n=1 Tax=Luteibacter sp. Sphag1AF TaxID=2587031 RepID=UPI00161990E8|nr:energy transducer TonB [Luteibacter sp. Sphag1AF]MBB3226510.1 hypothetical protein [Luteibacter sp. Sphag1AF]
MTRFAVGMGAFLVAGLAIAGGPAAVRKQIEASMVVTGSVDVSPEGAVTKYVVDQPEKIPADVVSLIQRSAAQWRFKPVLLDGKPVNAHATMSLRVVASPNGDGTYVARVKGANFGEGTPSDSVTYVDHKPPTYPELAVRARVPAAVYLLLRVGRDGHVMNVDAEQINLEAVAAEPDMRALRRMFATASVAAARKWTFALPTTGSHISDDSWVVRVPILFRLNQDGVAKQAGYGQWEAYVPGPKEHIAWLDAVPKAKDESAGAADALPEGGLYLVGSGLTLLTPTDHS